MSRPRPRRTLADEHADLLREVDARREQVLAALSDGRWPDVEIGGLVGYLRYELLDQATHEERLLYPLTAAGFTDERVRRLTEEHVRLRDAADALAATVAVDRGHRDGQRLAGTLAELHRLLERHLDHEQEVLSAATESGIEELRRPFRSHDWFSLTEGPVVDLDRLPREFAATATLDRLLRMRPGERLELVSGGRLQPLYERLASRDLSADYGWAYLEEGPERWRAAITRRASSG